MIKIILLFLFVPILLLSQKFNPNNYEEDIKLIISEALGSDFAYNRLGYLCDTFGPRLSGSENLERAISWIYQEMNKDGLENVAMEEVFVPNWKRNTENLKMVHPRHAHFRILGLGGSIATPALGIKAEVLVVKDKNDLERNRDKAKGKIVLFNFPFTSYGETVQYRFYGAQWAASVGAVASLIRSVSPIGMDNPHTGMMAYNDTIPKIPHAAITAEDADMLQRFQERGVTPVLHLKMNAETLPDALSHNVMGEHRGSETPEIIVALGGHIDSWDVGHGAHDDAGGCVATWEAVRIIKKLGLKTKKTLRAVMWTNEENGVAGGNKYAEVHGNEPHALVFESDIGSFKPSHIRFTGDEETYKIVQSFEPLLKLVRSEMEVGQHGGGVDISPMMNLGVSGMSLSVDDEGKYFWYHHSPADTFDKIDKLEFNQCVAAIAVAVYLFANI